jgi:His/Glu/Gln/Arg/opine family amino acid ABC transporter permease subunit
MDWGVLWQYRAALLQGLADTLAISALAIICSFVLGTLIGCLRLLQSPLLKEIIGVYIEVMRNMPVIVQVFFLFDVVGLDAFSSGLIALTLHQSGYIADVVASGFRSVAAEQSESGYAQGLTRYRVFVFVLLPQVARIVMAPMTNQFVEVVKNSAVVMFIGVQELTYQTQEIALQTLRGLEAATAATVLYVAITISIVSGMNLLGQRLRWPS